MRENPIYGEELDLFTIKSYVFPETLEEADELL